jgi:hypothetical protein
MIKREEGADQSRIDGLSKIYTAVHDSYAHALAESTSTSHFPTSHSSPPTSQLDRGSQPPIIPLGTRFPLLSWPSSPCPEQRLVHS